MSAFEKNQIVNVIHHFAGWKVEGTVIGVASKSVLVRFQHPKLGEPAELRFTFKGEEFGHPNKNQAACIRAKETV